MRVPQRSRGSTRVRKAPYRRPLFPVVAWQWNGRTILRGISHLCSCFWARLALGPYACSISFLFIGLTRLEQTFHWLVSVSRDFRSPKALFPIHLLLSLLFKHLDKGSLVPPCAHMVGPRSAGLLHYLHKVVGCFVPRSRSSFPGPDPRSSVQILFPRSRSLFLFRILVPRSGCNL